MTLAQDKPIAMSVPEAATQAGVSEATLYMLANSSQLPGARRLGKRIVIHRETFEAWLAEGMGE